MNNFLYLNYGKIYEKEPRYNETSLKQTNFASPLALYYIEVPLYHKLLVSHEYFLKDGNLTNTISLLVKTN